MRLAILSMLAAAAGIAASVMPATASYDYPYCLQTRDSGALPTDCNYQTYDQCRASASGRAASCAINPRVAFQNQRQYRQGHPRNYRGEDNFYGRY